MSIPPGQDGMRHICHPRRGLDKYVIMESSRGKARGDGGLSLNGPPMPRRATGVSATTPVAYPQRGSGYGIGDMK